LGEKTAKKIVREFYTPGGLSFSIGRLVIGGTDFSTRKYTYNDDGNSTTGENEQDFNLDHFSLQDEDTKLKVNIFVAELRDELGRVKRGETSIEFDLTLPPQLSIHEISNLIRCHHF
jgi:hypothetical protein